MKKLILLLVLLLPSLVFAETYFVREDGESNLADSALSSTGDPDNATYSMALTTMVGETYATGDIIRLSINGGDYTTTLTTPALPGGPKTATITNVVGEATLPTIVVTSTNQGINSNINGHTWNISNMIVDASGTTGTTWAVFLGRATNLDNVTVIGQVSGIAVQVQGSNQTGSITNCNISGGKEGIHVSAVTADSFDITDSDVYSNAEEGVVFGGSSVTRIDRCNIYGNTGSGIELPGTAVVGITDCTVYSNLIDGVTTTGTAVANCVGVISYNNGVQEASGSGDGFTAHDDSIINLDRCIAYGNTRAGVNCIQQSGGSIYNSTFYNNYDTSLQKTVVGSSTAHGIGISVVSDTGNWTIKNNITAYNDAEVLINVTGAGSVDADNNIYYANRGVQADKWRWTDTWYEAFAIYKIASSESNSLETDPNLASSAKLWPVDPSPADGGGISVVGKTNRLVTSSFWADSVTSTVDADMIGAFILGPANANRFLITPSKDCDNPPYLITPNNCDYPPYPMAPVRGNANLVTPKVN